MTRDDDWLVVAKAYAERWERATDDCWMSAAANRSDLDAIALDCRTIATRKSRPFEEVVDELLDAAFADEWLTSEGWPLRAIAKSPGKYRHAPSRARMRPPVSHDHPELVGADTSDEGIARALGAR